MNFLNFFAENGGKDCSLPLFYQSRKHIICRFIYTLSGGLSHDVSGQTELIVRQLCQRQMRRCAHSQHSGNR